MKEQALKRVALFAGLPSSEIKRLAGTLGEREFPAGAIFIQEGETADFSSL